MKVLLLTQYFTPEPVEKFADLAQGLVQRGHEVEVLTGFPCYPQGKIYEGYRQKFCQQETINGYTVTRVSQRPDHSDSILRRALYYLSFAFSAATIGLVKVRRADVILVYQSALPVGLAAWVISRVRRIPYVLDVADLWPESVSASGMLNNGWLIWLITQSARFIYQGAARISVITHGYRDSLIALGVPAEKIDVIHYWVPAGKYDAVERDEQSAQQYGMSGRFNLVYAGAMGPCQQLATVLDAATLLRELPEVQFLLIGDGVEGELLKTRAREKGLENVRFLGRLPTGEVAKIYACADLLLVHLKPDAMSRVSIPSKTFACLASGRPLLMAVAGEAARLVKQHGCGITVAPSDPQKLAAAIREFRLLPEAEQQRMGIAARSAYLANYSSAVQIAKFEELLNKIVTSISVRRIDQRSFYRRRGKRILDRMLVIPALLILSPVMLALAVIIRAKLGQPVLFRQTRPGLHARHFKLIKFRSMLDAQDSQGILLPDEQRLTGFGKFLRSTSLDELPELWNILRGEMSFVGPRPLLREYLTLYTPKQARRHDVMPGLTGWSQIHGRNALSWDEKFQLDLWYVENACFLLDVKILAKTIGKVLTRQGVSQAGHATTEKFTGGNLLAVQVHPANGVIVLGAGGHAKVVISTLQAAGHKIAGVYDDAPHLVGGQILGIKVLGTIAALPTHSSARAIVAIGDSTVRQAIAERFRFTWVTLIHPTAWVDPSVRLGAGTVVMAGAVIQPGCQVGRQTIVNTAASVDHDCVLGDFVHVCPGSHLAGAVGVGERTLLGTGSVVIPGIKIGADTIVGAGAIVTGDLPAGVTAVGQPARVIKQNPLKSRAA